MLGHTTRASNPAWYQTALELDLQLHIRVDGPSVTTFFFRHSKARWTTGPSITEADLRDPAKMEACAAEILKQARSLKAHALGIILQIMLGHFQPVVTRPSKTRGARSPIPLKAAA